MFWLLREHHILPGDYYRLPEGDKTILKGFFAYEMERRSEL